jgi:hypothetical protein
VGTNLRCDLLVMVRSRRGDDFRTSPAGQLDGTDGDRAGPALDEHHAARDRGCGVEAAVGGDAGDAEAGHCSNDTPSGSGTAWAAAMTAYSAAVPNGL